MGKDGDIDIFISYEMPVPTADHIFLQHPQINTCKNRYISKILLHLISKLLTAL